MSEMWIEVVEALWIVGSALSWLSIVGLAIWVIGWGIRFKFWMTEIGLIIWTFSTLLLLLVLNNILGNFGSSSREWWNPPPNDFIWWYFSRFFINVAVAGVIIRMLNILRKHWASRTSIEVEIPARESRTKTGPNPTVPQK